MVEPVAADRPLWSPSPEAVAAANVTVFARQVARDWGAALPDFMALSAWARENPPQFFRSLWTFGGVIADLQGEVIVENFDRLPGARWFPGARLNFAENLLRRRDASPALIFQGEDRVHRQLSHAELYDRVSQLAQALAAEGIQPGDRVVGFMPNMPETVVAMLAATSLGAVWSSCSPDFGVQGVMDRFGQIAPKVLIGANGYYYNGKEHDSLARLRQITAQLPSLKRLIVVPYTVARPELTGLGNAVHWEDYLAPHRPGPIAFRRLPFNHPLYIMYSSGTTGLPKCMVHGAGGTLLQHLKEHLLHTDVKPGDRLFYFTTCGWMMWNWLASGLASQATLVLYDGSPFYPTGNALFDLADRAQVDIFGTSAKFLDAANKAEVHPIRTHKLPRVRTILSTGSPLAPASFDYVYSSVKSDVRLSSISGGTDILGCFAAGVPVLPVWRGEIQTLALGMRVEVFDDTGKPTKDKGELVCASAFPSVPLEFWNDPDGKKFHAAYFDVYPNVWRHGDWCEITPHGGMIIYGRSDAVLNPGGVRIGTAEIYRQVEQLEEIEEALCIGQDWESDVRVILFVRLRGGRTLDDALRDRIKKRIRDNTTPRHVPARVIQVSDIPRTISGKITELAVRDIVHGRPVKNRDALANPEALKLFESLPELQS
ncbi:MAG: acetoacetate--CoA ligase [Alphaproteobacteria bacterium]|nr:acetoacetate--CoA ligase [Alphaproteobacteria bacterium]